MKRVYVEDQFIRVTFPYDEALVNVMHGIPDAEFRKTPLKHWRVPATPFHAKKVFLALDPIGFHIYNSLVNLIESETAQDLVEEDNWHIDGLRNYQAKAVNFISATEGRVLVADEQGLGKTVEVLAWIKLHYDQLNRIFIEAPSNVIYKWRRECVRWLEIPKEEVGILTGFTSDWPDTPIVLASYTIATERYMEVTEWKPDIFVADEAHYLKNTKAQRTKAAVHINQASKFFIPMTGTPLLNRPIEIFSIMQLVDRAAFPNWWKFGNRYCGGEWGKIEGNEGKSLGYFKGKTNSIELKERLESQYMIRRLKVDVLDELPPLTRTMLPVDISNLKQYGSLWDVKYKNALAMLTALYQEVGRGKTKVAIAWVKEFFGQADDNVKLVVKCHHLANVERMKNALSDYYPVTIVGSDTGPNREESISKFQHPSKSRLIIITSAGAEGIDLFGVDGVDASRILFVEREWSPAKEEQAEARLHRMGQNNAVEAFYLVARQTFDERMAEVIDMKRTFIRDVVGAKEVDTTVTQEILKLMAKE